MTPIKELLAIAIELRPLNERVSKWNNDALLRDDHLHADLSYILHSTLSNAHSLIYAIVTQARRKAASDA